MPRAAVTSRQAMNFLQNLFQRSSEFDNAYWIKDATTNPTITANQIANPLNGAVDADLLTQGPGIGGHRIYGSSFTYKANQPQTYSIYTKNNNSQYFALTIDNGTEFAAIFDLLAGTITFQSFQANFYHNATFGIEAVPNQAGWYRVWATAIAKADRVNFPAFVIPISSSSAAGSGSGKSAYIWGAQLVAANWPGYYTPITTTPVTNPIRNKILSRAAVTSRAPIT